MDIEFTDRYGGHPPSWLRGCHAQCEAMGAVPIYRSAGDTRTDLNLAQGPDETSSGYISAWNEAHAKSHDEPCDGWHFVRCPDCHGTGRVSWFRTFARIPRWLVRGARFIWRTQTYPGPAPQHNRWQHFWLTFRCAYLADIGVWRP